MNKYLLSFSFVFYILYAGAQRFVIKNLDIEKLLPTQEIYVLLNDSRGYVWGASDAGLFRFNGKKLNRFSKKYGLETPTTLKISEDEKGVIWTMTNFNKIYYLNKNNKYISIGANNELSSILSKSGGLIINLAKDSTDCLLVGTSRGAFKIYPENNYTKIEAYTKYDSTCRAVVHQLDRNKLFVSSNLSSFKQVDFKPKETNSQTLDSFYKIQIITKKIKRSIEIPIDLKFKTNSSSFSALLLSDESVLVTQNNSVFHVHLNGIVTQHEFKKNIIALFQDNDGSIWISFYNDGVFFFENADLKTKSVNYLKGYTISSITQDREGALWFSSTEKGVFYCPGKYIYHFDSLKYMNRAIEGIQKIDSNIYFMNVEKDIFQIDKRGEIKLVTKIASNYDAELVDFYKYKNKSYISGYVTGETDKNFKVNKSFLMDGKPMLSKDLVVINDSMIWVIGHLNLFLIKNGKLEKRYLIPNRAKTIAKTSQNTLLIGTISGLYSFENEVFTLIKEGIISDIVVSENGTIYCSSVGNGVLIRKDKKWIKISKEEGLSSNASNRLNIANSNEIWTCYRAGGISCINLIENTFNVKSIENISDVDGLISKQVKDFCIRGNEIWVATIKGICLLKREGNYSNKIKAPIYLSEVFLNDSMLVKDSTYQFSYKQNTFTFFVDNLSYRNFGESSFLYRLNGKDTAFRTSTENKIEYQNLLNGNYSLEVISINSSGIKGKPKIIYSFCIQKPFWQTWWFICLDVLFVISVIWLFSFLRIKAIRKKELAKLRANQRLSELQLTALRAQMDPHFIFNALSGIQRYVLQKDKFETYDYITKFSHLIRDVLTSARVNSHSLKNELDTLKLYVDIELLRFDNGFDFVINMDETINPEKVIIPNMIIQPFIENAIWHGIMPMDKNIRGQITLTIQKQSNFLIIIIQDNGIGREASSKIKKTSGYKSYGIELTRNRIDIVNKGVEQNLGYVMITDVKNEIGQASGTKVELKIKLN